MKILYFDVETTGRDPKIHDIVQLSGFIEIDGVEKETFDFRIKPFDLKAVDPEALGITGLTLKEISEYPEPKEVYKKIIELFSKYVNKYDKADKFYPAGYNVKFDLDFLQELFHKCGDIYGTGTWQNWKAIDPLPVLQFMDGIGLMALPNYKLSTVCEHFGIKITAHNALSDIRATRELIERIEAEYFNQEKGIK
jgi:DNA polymerase-3 subunit epsilon